MTLAKITFYGINECGYYARDQERVEFGNCRIMIEEFRRWAKDDNKTLGETCTYHPSENSHLLRTFCYDCQHDEATGDHLLVTWNESPSINGTVAHVAESGLVGNTQVSNVDLPEGAVPGFPTYFLFLPAEQVFATIRFESPLNGNMGVQKLLKEFLAKFTTCCVHDEAEAANGRIKVLGYRRNAEAEIQHLYPRFSATLLRQPALLEYIRGARTSIVKVHRKNLLVSGDLPNAENEEVGIFTKLFAALGGTPLEARQDVPVTYEMTITPTSEELEQIITNWRQSAHTVWEDIGFQFSGDQNVRWLSSASVKIDLQLNVTPDENGIVDSRQFLAELLRVRNKLIRTINLRNNA